MRNAIIVGLAVVSAAAILVAPVDAQRMEPPPTFRLVGVTEAMFDSGNGVFPLTRACFNNFPGSRICTTQEIIDTVNPPVIPKGLAWVRPSPIYLDSKALNAVDVPSGATSRGSMGRTLSCEGYKELGSIGLVVDQDGRFKSHRCHKKLSVACCGF